MFDFLYVSSLITQIHMTSADGSKLVSIGLISCIPYLYVALNLIYPLHF
jgi:hypothetical protein